LDEREDKINYGNAFTDMTGYPDAPGSWRFHFDLAAIITACGFSFADGHSRSSDGLMIGRCPAIQPGGSEHRRNVPPLGTRTSLMQERSTRRK
jgi:hypothetical protein